MPVARNLPLLEILTRRATHGALLRRLNALQLLAARGADHGHGHGRVRGLTVFGLYLLAGVAGEVGDGDLAGYDILHGGTRSRERVFHEGEVDVRRAALAGELLGHVARDVAHEALGRPVQPLDGVVCPGELPGAALGDPRAGSLEGT